MANGTILVVDDDERTLDSLARVFRQRGYEVLAAADGEQGSALAAARSFDLVLLDIHLPGPDGLEVLQGIKERDPEAAVVMMTAFATVDTAVAALRLGATDYVLKPFELEQILLVVDRVFERKRLLADHQEFLGEARRRYDFSGIVTRSVRFREILASLRKVSAMDTTILITGESGTGKELAARAVHHHSARGQRAMIAVNCAAIPASLIEAELFGHVKGAFTGATGDRKGYFERADGSTLFLDEIGELPLDLQVKFLRVLQEHQIFRVGESRPHRVDFRLIAATQRDLAQDVRDHHFRQDLFYRLNVFPVTLPPLRERPEDVAPLVEHFLDRISRRGLTMADEALARLQAYSWPGNVRELENVVERAALLADGPVILAGDLPAEVNESEPSIQVLIPPEFADYKQVLKQVATIVRAEMVRRALQEHGGNVTHSARALGISRRMLIYTMQELGLSRGSVIAEEGEP
jgi:two-component system, NtrC family, response regulator AtoC